MTPATDARSAAQRNRGTLFVEDARITDIQVFPGDQYVLRLRAPRCAERASAGSFVHLRCDDAIPMRRPLSIMRADAAQGWIEVLFKVVGAGLKTLGRRQVGDVLNLIGPIGHGFEVHDERPRAVLIGGGVGIPPMVFLAEQMVRSGRESPLVLMGSELPFPFLLQPSALAIPWLGADTRSTMPLLEDQGICTRLASLSNFSGVFPGYVTDLSRKYLEWLDDDDLARVEVFACGPDSMLRAVAAQAAQFGLPCQVSLEEFMACAVGGCAGCTVLVRTVDGPAMKRVCVDGPVFDAGSVYGAS